MLSSGCVWHGKCSLLLQAVHDLINPLYEQAEALRDHLVDTEELSFASFVDDNFRKVLLLAVASAFEARLSQHVLDFARDQLSEDHPLAELVRIKAVERQYHTWFQWESSNVHQFLGLFGEHFKNFSANRIAGSADLQKACRDFLELGSLRNRLVHRNFSAFSLEKTTAELYALFTSACRFVNAIPELLADFQSS
jgi:hypothetical protein